MKENVTNVKQATNKVHNVSQFSNKYYPEYSLHRLLKNILIAAQCFSLLPVDGITKDNHEDVRFSWKSFKTIYSIIVLFLQLIYSSIIFIYSVDNSENFFSFVVVVWNVRALLGLIILIRVAKQWPNLIRQWSEMEAYAIPFGPLRSLKLRFQIITFISLLCGFVEHGIFVYGGITKALSKMRNNDNFFELYFGSIYEEFFGMLTYSVWIAIPVEFLALTSTFLWQFIDILIILLSVALAERFRQITRQIRENQFLTELQWRDLRKHYNRLHLLCRTLNNTIVEIILLSFCSNVFFVSVSVFSSFTEKSGYQAFYFWYGLIFSIVHFFVVCLYGSWVYEESIEPITDIAGVSAKNMSHEVERMLHQMASKNIGLNGGGLFRITRGAILNIASVVVTLQLIFIQFDAQLSSNV